MDLRIRKAVTRYSARLIRVGDHAVDTFVPEMRVSSVAAIPPEAFEVERLAVVWDGVDVEMFSAFSKRMTEVRVGKNLRVFGYVPGEQGNARGAETLGMLPRSGGLETRGMFDYARKGMLRSLCLFGVNPLLRYVDAGLAHDAIEKAPFVVACDLFMTQTAQRATLVLPARATFEKEGHTTSLTGEILRLMPALSAPVGTLSDGEMLVALAAELGVDIPTPGALRAVASAPAHAGERLPKPGGNGHVEARSDERASDAALRVAITASPFSGGGTLAFDERIKALRDLPTATVSQACAQEYGLSEGDVLDIAVGERALCDLTVRVCEHGADGTVTIIDGLPSAPANIFAAGEAVRIRNHRSARGERMGAAV